MTANRSVVVWWWGGAIQIKKGYKESFESDGYFNCDGLFHKCVCVWKPVSCTHYIDAIYYMLIIPQ